MNINVIPGRVILLVGPSGSGKSILAGAIKANLDSLGFPVKLLSSDTIRREILKDPTVPYDDPRMLEVSHQAFKLLYQRLDEYMSLTNNIPCIIVDTTAITEKSRKNVYSLAEKHGYVVDAVIFNYKNKNDFGRKRADQTYEEFPDWHKKMIEAVPSVVESMTKGTESKICGSVLEITEPDTLMFKDLVVTVQNLDVWKKTNIIATESINFIGDLHESAATLKHLRENLPPGKNIFLGDYLDRKTEKILSIDFETHKEKITETIELLEDELKKGSILIMGNHENYAIQRLKGNTSACSVEQEYFSSVPVLLNNSDLADRFLAIAEKMVPFVVIEHPVLGKIYAMHAPAKDINVGKLDKASIKQQRNQTYSNFESGEDFIKYIETCPDYTDSVLKICGHIPVDKTIMSTCKKFLYVDHGGDIGDLAAVTITEKGEISLVSQAGRFRETYLVANKKTKEDGFVLSLC